MQFSPWTLPQGLTWTQGGLGQVIGLPQNPQQNHIIIRPTQPDGTPGPQMFLQSPPPQAMAPQPQQGINTVATVQQMGKPRPTLEMATNIQPKMQPRTVPTILPSHQHRPASSVSTQTIQNASPTQVSGAYYDF